MDYYEKIKRFIYKYIEDNLNESYLKPWLEDDFSEEEMKYITPKMGMIDEEKFYNYKFRLYNDNYKELFRLYGKPTIEEYHYIIGEMDMEYFDNYHLNFEKIFKNTKYENVIELTICSLAEILIYEFNNNRKEDIEYEVEKRKKAIIIIQRAFRKYRYEPRYKFCNLVQARNMVKDNIISQEEFEKYLKKENIKYRK